MGLLEVGTDSKDSEGRELYMEDGAIEEEDACNMVVAVGVFVMVLRDLTDGDGWDDLYQCVVHCSGLRCLRC